MGAGHDHGAEAPVDPATRRALAVAVAVCGLIAMIAAIITWPASENENTFNLGADLFNGTVERVVDCPAEVLPDNARDIECFVVQAEVNEGIDAGQLFELPPFFEARVSFEPGDKLVLTKVNNDDAPFRYAFQDRNRKAPLLLLTVIGALGALDDMTVTQASVIFELRRSSPSSSRRDLFASGMRVGRDHVASTVNTLFLAYVGAALPLLLLFSVGQLPAIDVANSEVVATEIVRTLVGSIGLVASVPLTTWLAVSVVGDGSGAPKVKSGQRPPKRRTPSGEMTETTATGGALPDNAGDSGIDQTDEEATNEKWKRWSNMRDGIDE